MHIALVFVGLLLSIQHGLSYKIKGDDKYCKTYSNDGNSVVPACVCNEDYCDELELRWPQKSKSMLIETNSDGLRFAQRQLKTNEFAQPEDIEEKIVIDPSRKFQSIMGWGGAFTDSTGINIASLSNRTAKLLMESLFGKKGLGYTYGRVPIGGADFSARGYTYDDTPEPDYELKHWQLAKEDMQYKIPYIKQARKLVKDRGQKLRLFGSPWSAPAWMKTSNSLIGGQLKKDDKIYKSWADYLMKFYDAYRKQGIEFWGATVQNEPMISWNPDNTINAMPFVPNDLARLVGDFLGPALEAKNMTKENFKLMIADDNLGLANMLVQPVMTNSSIAKYVSGVAFHWYFSGVTASYEDISLIHHQFGSQLEFMLMTEASICMKPDPQNKTSSWTRAQQYATDIIQDLHHHTGGWIDWNMALDSNGGPNWVNNFVDSPILVYPDRDEFHKQPSYYALAHFTRTFREGARRVQSEVANGNSPYHPVETVAVYDGHLVVNVLNKSDKRRLIRLQIKGLGERKFTVTPESVNTYILAM